jgi:serine/threonine protein kinase/tetratricopeptide (TPR) repeat protein
MAPDRMRETIGRYRIVGRLGEGGMGIVYDAWDDQLGRPVAVKTLRGVATDARAEERLRREARAAASLNHPNICQLYEIGEDGDTLYIAMERLEGESLAARLARNTLAPVEAAQVALAILTALEAVHRRGLVHRDLKPSNVFLTPHGVKLLDFGVARQVQTTGNATEPELTLPGTVVGTPFYMAPEQVLGQVVDARADLFAVGAMLFEMLSGSPPFAAPTPAAVLERLLTERPPALGGSPSVAAIDRVLHRALARRPEQRYPDAGAMAQDLRLALRFADSGEQVLAHPIRRLAVLPFRLLRPDADTDFLAFGLADAITGALSGRSDLTVRSSLAVARHAVEQPDLRALASEADVDLVVSGTLLRAGSRIRVSAQLIELPSGTVRWSHTSDAALTDLLQVQDDLAALIVTALSMPLMRSHGTAGTTSGRAHELYLRANQLSFEPRTWARARQLYEDAVQEDPQYAAAWARLGRMYRVMSKYAATTDPAGDLERAEQAFRRALAIDADLSLAHTLYSQLELELGRGQEAMVRLLQRAQRNAADAHLFAGLVHACRYCGLLDASIAAHEHVRRLDVQMPTGVMYTGWMKGDYLRALEEAQATADPFTAFILLSLGRADEALALLRREEERFRDTLEANWARTVRVAIEGPPDEALGLLRQDAMRSMLTDPEARYLFARLFAYLEETNEALTLLASAVEGGFFPVSALTRDDFLDPLRGMSRFRTILETAERRQAEATQAFIAAGGERILAIAVR